MKHRAFRTCCVGNSKWLGLAFVTGAMVCGFPLMAESGTQASSTKSGSSFEEQAQTTLGGAEYFLTGEVIKIDGQTYWVKNASGSEVRLEVSDDTHMFCGTRQGRSQSTGEAQQEHKPGSGFRLGDCPFQTGDYIKAETTDLGTVSYMAALTRPQESETQEIGMPQDYGVLAVPTGELEAKGEAHHPVQTKDGEAIGTLEYVIVDKRLGATAYGVIALQDGQLLPVPWKVLDVRTEGQQKTIVLRVPKEHLNATPALELEEGAGSRISMTNLRQYWSEQGQQARDEKQVHPSAPWVEEIRQAFETSEEFQKALASNPEQPDKFTGHLNEAARSLKEKEEETAREHFGRALHSLDEVGKTGQSEKSVVEEMKATILVHAPSPLSQIAQTRSGDMPVKMEEAIKIASQEAPGEILEADYLGRYGRKVYQILSMEGTGVTRMIEVNAETGKIETNLVLAGRPMPDEPFR